MDENESHLWGNEFDAGSIKHARAQVKKLLAEKRRLEASNKHLLARQDVLTSGTALADQYLRYFVAEKSLSRQDRQRRHLEKARQASALWTELRGVQPEEQ